MRSGRTGHKFTLSRHFGNKPDINLSAGCPILFTLFVKRVGDHEPQLDCLRVCDESLFGLLRLPWQNSTLGARRNVVKADEVDLFAFAVFCHFEQVEEAREA